MSAILSKQNLPKPRPEGVWPRVFSLLFGAFIGLSLLKFGDACLFEALVPWPENVYEWVLNHWPVKIGYWLLVVLAIVGVFVARLQTNTPRWVLALPLVWLGWQFVSATQTVDVELTRQTLYHFTACVVCFYLGMFCLSRERSPLFFWLPVLCAMMVVVSLGIHQHFGGLEETRRYFFAYVYPQLGSVPPEYLKRMSSDRIFSTLFYPNTLAGAILLLLPPTSVVLWRVLRRLTLPTRCLLTVIYGVAALGCLLWSGSKGGWLLALLSGLVALLHLSFAKRLKEALVIAFLVAGVAGFFWKYSGFFERGAKSVHARFDYWQAATQTTVSKPVFGSGPGTFGIAYKAIKKPESEMARLAHNDYLQQASDSGILGFAAFVTWMIVIVRLGYAKPDSPSLNFQFCVWVGLLGWALHGILEFGLYIPALAWTGFAMSGWVLSVTSQSRSPRYAESTSCAR